MVLSVIICTKYVLFVQIGLQSSSVLFRTKSSLRNNSWPTFNILNYPARITATDSMTVYPLKLHPSIHASIIEEFYQIQRTIFYFTQPITLHCSIAICDIYDTLWCSMMVSNELISSINLLTCVWICV